LSSFAELARKNNWVRPMMLPREHILVSLEGGRHPIVEQRCLRFGSYFVANDIELDKGKCSLALITGPNMAGKSTIMRQVALIQIMAQMGSYVPATKASLSICDSIFARVGASDDLSLGRSTFMVEMAETSNILQNATPYSLILLDEIGRGTSTYDGMSIAQAVAEYIHDVLKSRTLFATHYHELTELEKNLGRLCNFHVEVEERAESVHFLYRLKSGPALKSFGIQVAKLAGLPEVVLERAQEVLAGLEKSEKPKAVACLVQPDLFKVSQASHDAKNILEQIARLDLNRLTPLQALNKLYSLQQRLLLEINAPN
jgi:DNA mismatch repair protein MutS